MSKTTSNVTSLSVYDSQAAIPVRGFAKQVATSGFFNNTRPVGMTLDNWRYALFGSFGSGVFNPYYSTNGAYILALSGGHNHPGFFGAFVFDFDTMLPSYISCTNPGLLSQYTAPVADSRTNLAPWWEMLESPEVPTPPHPYKNQQVISPVRGGGPQGSMIYIGRGAANIAGGGSSTWAHAFELTSGRWARKSTNATAKITEEGATAYDAVTDRYYVINRELEQYQSLRYLDGSDWTFKSGPSWVKAGPAVSGSALCAWIQTGGGVRALMVGKGTRLYGINLDSQSAGLVQVTTTGETIVDNYGHPVLHEAQNIVYRRVGAPRPQGQKLQRWTPPVGNPISGTWSIDSVTLNGDPIPDYYATPYMTTQPYRNLMYLPALQILAWVTPNGVYLLNP